jgi:hypothetical protein
LIYTAITAGISRVAYAPLCLHAVANTPAGQIEACSLLQESVLATTNRRANAKAAAFPKAMCI